MLSKSPTKWFERFKSAVNPQNADLLMIGNYFKTATLERTARGIDVDGRTFASYSTKRAYYWNPYSGNKRQSGTRKKQNAAMNRMIKKLGGSTKTGIIRDPVTGKAVAHRSGTGTSIRFASYDAFKRSLGRSNVDLTGPRAPHMLQALTVRVAEDGKGVILGIYGEAAGRAKGHQNGNPARGLPQRKFLGATPEDRAHALRLLSAQVHGRIRAAVIR